MAEIEDIVADVRALLAGSKGTLRVSPEVAAWVAAVSEAVAPARNETAEVAASPAPAPRAEPQRSSLAAPVVAGDRESALAALAQEVSACTRCDLCQQRKQTVFSDGSPHAQVVFVGEAPGADEDAKGVPFVGRAGQLLTRIIERVMGLQRHEVYICNVIKCRPPGNRDPQASEKAACMPYLSRQLALVQPKVIVALGRHAANSLIGGDESIGRLRDRWHFYEGIPVRVTYHPAYILRCEDDKERERTEKAKVKADIDEVLRVLSGEITPMPGGGDGRA